MSPALLSSFLGDMQNGTFDRVARKDENQSIPQVKTAIYSTHPVLRKKVAGVSNPTRLSLSPAKPSCKHPLRGGREREQKRQIGRRSVASVGRRFPSPSSHIFLFFTFLFALAATRGKRNGVRGERKKKLGKEEEEATGSIVAVGGKKRTKRGHN